ncbi:MAG: bifunctional phosphopantothenoylcysteine decarboxylase/phosphopantothenate--cysteine ligase CoaBC [Syntrophomonadaceae bacterium]|jgi:phosphopantothenoylcysteine decarboxylase/phosphopantothenate--cysteine ligase|nr:bifunctional phosphopantothenoylcysteine decarboxylase/phosphopantothenate--cysteine ligase CoaBC [Syntrophomonadaceae bacterium]
MNKPKTVVVGITGGIAAYKIAELVSRLYKNGFNVQVVMTKHATRFITPLTLRTLSNNPVLVDMFDESGTHRVQHIGVAEEADILVIAPATANIIAKMACGIADDLLSTIVLATRAPVLLAPSMNTNMYDHPATQDNIRKLKDRGVTILEPAEGELACGVTGRGRLPEIETIYDKIIDVLEDRPRDLVNKTILVTAGATQEDIDPVRFITNHSTGKMGYALAAAAVRRGARVFLVSGPTYLTVPDGVESRQVRSAREMNDICHELFGQVDVVIGAAAVADYRPLDYSDEKLKKNDNDMVIKLTRNPDILEGLGKRKQHQILVGFAAETSDVIQNARQKMQKKNLDLLVANDLTVEGAGFAGDTNIVTLLFKDGREEKLPLMSKLEVAGVILDAVLELF